MRDRFDAVEVWKNLGLDPVACGEHMHNSGFMTNVRSSLFQRIVPIANDLGLLDCPLYSSEAADDLLA